MACRTVSRAIEITAAGFHITRIEVLWIDAAASAAHSFHFGFLIVNESDDRVRVLDIQTERRHAFLDAPGANYRPYLVAAEILRNQHGPREIRPGLAARSIAPMTESALRNETAFAGADELRRIGLCLHCFRRPLRCG